NNNVSNTPANAPIHHGFFASPLTSHILMSARAPFPMPSQKLTMRFPSGLKTTLSTLPVCPLRVRISRPEVASQSFTVWSPLPLTICLPSGLKAALRTDAVCPLIARVPLPLLASHTLTTCSPPPQLTIRFPSGLKARLLHPSGPYSSTCPPMEASFLP